MVGPGPIYWITQPGLRPQNAATHCVLLDAWRLRNLGAFPECGGDSPSRRNENPEAKIKDEVDLAMLELYDDKGKQDNGEK